MKKTYYCPQNRAYSLQMESPLLGLSVDDGTDVPVNPGEGQDPGDALTKGDVFDHSWE
ncbi:MAG: hypothetical protein J5545_01820 [Bacteroidaceae bacterium]|nr:hypothetical protein [Bacteroidaceae bacterium]